MAFSVASVPAVETAALALDKPVFAASNALRSYNQVPAFFTTRTWAGTQVDQATTPGYWAHDDTMVAQARPTDTTIASMFLLFDLDDTAGHEIDMAIIGNHNFSDLAGTVTVKLYFADDSAFTTNLRTAYTWTISDASRLVSMVLDTTITGPFRYSAVRYAGIGITTTSTFSTANGMPQIGEVFLGRRRQLARKHDYPGDDLSESSVVETHETTGGYSTQYRDAYGRRDLSLSWTSDTADVLGIDDQAVWRSLWTDSEQGTRPFWYLREPSTAPGNAVLMRAPSPRMSFNHLGPNHGERRLAMVEQPPFLSREI